jgi:eukaryotic-like serine/threonine-protein kinase
MADELIAGRYRLVEPLGRGSMSSVWLAEDEELGRRVAVKTLAPTADRARFEREARAVASLSHPNVCALWDYGEAEGKPYMVLEYLEGGTLEDRLKTGRPLPDADTERIAREMASGLAQAHARGLVHRDLKPANILFDGEGRAKIADFGIARMGAGGLTETGTVLGTASYISPEQAAGEAAGPASDVYSFGVILFRMLTGRLPFVATNALELVRMHRDDPPPTVASVRPDAPPRLADIADASLAKTPGARPEDGAALVAALAGGTATIVLPSADAATRIIRPAHQRPAGRRRSLPVLAVGVLVAALVAGGALAAWLTTRPDAPSEPAAPPPTLVLPTVPPGATSTASLPTTSTAPTTTHAATTTAPPTTTAATTTVAPRPTTTTPATTTAPPTTEPATTAELPTTTEPVTTTEPPPTTEPVTTDTTPATTAAAP